MHDAVVAAVGHHAPLGRVGCQRVGFLFLAVVGCRVAGELALRAEMLSHHLAQHVGGLAVGVKAKDRPHAGAGDPADAQRGQKSEEHTSALRSLMSKSYGVFWFEKKIKSN